MQSLIVFSLHCLQHRSVVIIQYFLVFVVLCFLVGSNRKLKIKLTVF